MGWTPTSLYMIMSSLAPLLMSPSSIGLSRTVACQGHFPPPAIVEVLQDYVTNFHEVPAAASCCGGLVAAMEVQYCPGQRNF